MGAECRDANGDACTMAEGWRRVNATARVERSPRSGRDSRFRTVVWKGHEELMAVDEAAG